MRFFIWGQQEDQSEEKVTGVVLLKELWGIGDEKSSYKPVTTPISSNIYHVPLALNTIPRRRHCHR
ncbi:MAG: hypothetical protein KJ726_03875 [Verrucomicrobia bacterium]|nr:hypothetical protein [Verrucomicrobiota bacterium]MBU1909164.1 hypothetical protein [Verrucomicrobiota bacterium]